MQFRSFFLLVVALILSSAFAFAADTVTLYAGGSKVSLHISPVVVDDALYVPLAALSAVGAKSETDARRKEDGQAVEVISATGRRVRCKARLINGELMLPIMDLAPELGAVAEWDKTRKILSLRARIEHIEFDGSLLVVSTSYPVVFEESWWKAQNRLILDLHGVQMPPKAPPLKITNSTSVTIRTGLREDGETGRIVLDMPNPVKFQVKSAHKTSRIVVSVSGLRPSQTSPTVPSVDDVPAADGTPAASPQPAKPELPPAQIGAIKIRKLGSDQVEVRLPSSRQVEYTASLLREPDRLVIDIHRAVFAGDSDGVEVEHSLLQAVRAAQSGESTVRVTMDLSRVPVYHIRYEGADNEMVFRLRMPKGAGGLLSDKVVVIDPGHGGRYRGCRGNGGMAEEEYNMQIARRVKDALVNAGVAAFLTHESAATHLDGSDLKADLLKRADFAKRHSADFFVSIHCNSCQIPGSISGTETFYQRGDLNGRALAESVHAEVVKAMRLPDRKVKSAGFVVLSRSSAHGIPAILVEVGFLNHPTDSSRIASPEYQQSFAEAIVRGLKSYVEGNNRPLRRSEEVEVKPELEKADIADEPAPDVQPLVESDSDERPVSPSHIEPARASPPAGPRRPGEQTP